MLTRAQTHKKRSLVEANLADNDQNTATKSIKLTTTAPPPQSPQSTNTKQSTLNNTTTATTCALQSSTSTPTKRRPATHRRRTELSDLKANATSFRHSLAHHRLHTANKSSGRLFSLQVVSATDRRLLCRVGVRWSDRVWAVKERLERRLGECVVWQQLWMDRNGWKAMQDGWTMAQCFNRQEDAMVRLKVVEPSW